jgi:hypothetical protein
MPQVTGNGPHWGDPHWLAIAVATGWDGVYWHWIPVDDDRREPHPVVVLLAVPPAFVIAAVTGVAGDTAWRLQRLLRRLSSKVGRR